MFVGSNPTLSATETKERGLVPRFSFQRVERGVWTNPLGSTIRQDRRIGRAQRAPSDREGRGPRMARVNPTLSATNLWKSGGYEARDFQSPIPTHIRQVLATGRHARRSFSREVGRLTPLALCGSLQRVFGWGQSGRPEELV